jgi:hypothetical protein
VFRKKRERNSERRKEPLHEEARSRLGQDSVCKPANASRTVELRRGPTAASMELLKVLLAHDQNAARSAGKMSQWRHRDIGI